jgi:DNA-binding response OmpR family regulator
VVTAARTILIATDADEVFDEVDAALGETGTTIARVHTGREVLNAVKQLEPDLVVLDLQIGNMGGVATCLGLRNEESFDRITPQRVIILLDRDADVFIARRADADGWLVKPLDALRLRKAAATVMAGETYSEGGIRTPPVDTAPIEGDESDADGEPAEDVAS